MWFTSIASAGASPSPPAMPWLPLSVEPAGAGQEEMGSREQPVPDMQVRSCVFHNRIIGNICRHQEIGSGEYTICFLFQRVTTMKIR